MIIVGHTCGIYQIGQQCIKMMHDTNTIYILPQKEPEVSSFLMNGSWVTLGVRAVNEIGMRICLFLLLRDELLTVDFISSTFLN